MIFVYNIVNIIAWSVLAVRFNKWWIALFAVFTMLIRRKTEDEG